VALTVAPKGKITYILGVRVGADGSNLVRYWNRGGRITVAGRALAVNENTAPPTVEQIRQRAYELYVEGGCQPGKELDHWLQAEAEFKQSQKDKLATRRGDEG